MIDFYKYSKKNFLFKFIIQNIFGVKLDLLKKSFFCTYKIDLKLDDSFFKDYMKKYPITKWGGKKNNKEHYQSNHDLNRFKILKKPINQIETILNSEVKKNFLGMTCFGKFRIKSLWFTIQKKNEGHNKHNHPKSILSGVYYYRIEENKGGELEIFTQQKIINHNPKKNDLIVFNSDTFHSVKPYYGNNDRIAIAWDAIYTF
jgi:hypothetical protein